MASRTVVDSVVEVQGPPLEVLVLGDRLRELRQRHPGAVFERYLDKLPRVASDAFVAPGAVLIGDVELAEQSSVWFGCVLRADLNQIKIGRRSNLQDGCVVHLGDRDPTVVEEEVVVGHRAVLHGCHVGSGALIGIQASVLDGAMVGEESVIGAGAIVKAGTRIPPRSLVLGVPGVVVKQLSARETAYQRQLAAKYVRLAHNYRVG